MEVWSRSRSCRRATAKGGGLRAVRGILEVAPDTAIVMLSGFGAEGVVRELIQGGAIAYRRKCVSLNRRSRQL